MTYTLEGMKLFSVALFCAVSAWTLEPQLALPSDASVVLARTRAALGGEKALGAVNNFVVTGRTQQLRGINLVPIEFEIACELPGKYVRRDEIPAQESEPTRVGFNGEAGILQPPPSNVATQPARLAAARQDFARLTLGMFAGSFSALPLTFTLAGQAQAPEGKADVVDVRSAAGALGRLFIDSATHLPIMFSWPTTAQGKTTETRLYYGDYRETSGVTWPFRLKRAVGGDTVEETTFDKFKINTKIDPKKFEVSK